MRKKSTANGACPEAATRHATARFVWLCCQIEKMVRLDGETTNPAYLSARLGAGRSGRPIGGVSEANCREIEKMVRPKGFEPLTFGFGGRHSIQLSYGRPGRSRTVPHPIALAKGGRDSFFRESRHPGFGLVETAMAVSLLALAGWAALAALGPAEQRTLDAETMAILDRRSEDLAAMAAATGTLPCPDANGDGLADGGAGACAATTGQLPWLTLGLSPDAALGADTRPLEYTVRPDLTVADALNCATALPGASPDPAFTLWAQTPPLGRDETPETLRVLLGCAAPAEPAGPSGPPILPTTPESLTAAGVALADRPGSVVDTGQSSLSLPDSGLTVEASSGTIAVDAADDRGMGVWSGASPLAGYGLERAAPDGMLRIANTGGGTYRADSLTILLNSPREAFRIALEDLEGQRLLPFQWRRINDRTNPNRRCVAPMEPDASCLAVWVERVQIIARRDGAEVGRVDIHGCSGVTAGAISTLPELSFGEAVNQITLTPLLVTDTADPNSPAVPIATEGSAVRLHAFEAGSCATTPCPDPPAVRIAACP